MGVGSQKGSSFWRGSAEGFEFLIRISIRMNTTKPKEGFEFQLQERRRVRFSDPNFKPKMGAGSKKGTKDRKYTDPFAEARTTVFPFFRRKEKGSASFPHAHSTTDGELADIRHHALRVRRS